MSGAGEALAPGPAGQQCPAEAGGGRLGSPAHGKECLRGASFWDGALVAVGGCEDGLQLRSCELLHTPCCLKQVFQGIPVPDQQPDRRAGSLVPLLPLPGEKQDDFYLLPNHFLA